MSTVRANNYYDASGGSNAQLFGVASPPNSMGFRNRIINGGMVIDQRNAGGSVSIGTGTPFIVDRWNAYTDLLNMTGQRSTIVPSGFTNSLGITVGTGASPSAGQISRLEQRIEGFNFSDLGWGAAGAQSVTVSFWVRSSVTGTHSGALGNSAANRGYPFTFTISTANTWEYKTVTIAGDTTGTWLTDNGTGVRVLFNLGTGSTFLGTAGSWAASNFFGATGSVQLSATTGATFYITGVQLEAGTNASAFERRPYGTELMLCQRYYMGISGSASNTLYVFTAQAVANNYALGNFQPFVPMRATPVISYNLIAASNSTGSSSGATTVTIEAGSTGQSLRVGVTGGTGLTAGNASIIGLTSSSSFFNLSAEL